MTQLQLSLAIRLRDEATFANYFPGKNAAACGYVEHACGNSQNEWIESLIWLWGPLGSGRSHLLQAACTKASELGKKARYLPLAECVEYGSYCLDGLEQGDLVALDDLHLALKLEEWQQPLFHAFNRIRDAGATLLLSAERSPHEFSGLLPDLHSRLNLALVFQLHPLSDEEMLRAIQLRASRRGLFLADEVATYLLSRLPRDMGSMFSALEHLDQASLQAKRKLTIPFVRQVLFAEDAALSSR